MITDYTIRPASRESNLRSSAGQSGSGAAWRQRFTSLEVSGGERISRDPVGKSASSRRPTWLTALDAPRCRRRATAGAARRHGDGGPAGVVHADVLLQRQGDGGRRRLGAAAAGGGRGLRLERRHAVPGGRGHLLGHGGPAAGEAGRRGERDGRRDLPGRRARRVGRRGAAGRGGEHRPLPARGLLRLLRLRRPRARGPLPGRGRGAEPRRVDLGFVPARRGRLLPPPGQEKGDSTSLQRGRSRSDSQEESIHAFKFVPRDDRSSKNEPNRVENDRDRRF